MENELADLTALQGLKEQNQMNSFKEEIASRGFSSADAYYAKVKFLQIKLGIQSNNQEEKEEAEKNKYALLEIADEFLKPE